VLLEHGLRYLLGQPIYEYLTNPNVLDVAVKSITIPFPDDILKPTEEVQKIEDVDLSYEEDSSDEPTNADEQDST